MSNLFNELKRRNVFKVATAYLVVGWLVVQVAGTIAPMMSLPDVAPRYILFLLIVLFPIVLFMAWIFDIKPTGGEQEAKSSVLKSLIPLGAAILMLGGISYGLLLKNESETVAPDTPQTVLAPVALNKASIAVLAFADLSPNGDQEYFGDGISESLLNVLAKIKELDVSSRTSSFAFKGKDRNVTDIGDILNVKHVLEGSVKKAGNRILITAQLIDAPENRHLWSDTYERELTTENIFAIQAEIAAAIVKALGEELDIGLESEAKIDPFTANMDAYDLYLQAKKESVIYSLKSARNNVTLFGRAVELDPDFAEAWAMYAQSLSNLPTWDDDLDNETYQHRAITAAEKALVLSPENETAYDALYSSYIDINRWDKADEVVSRARSYFPNFAMGSADTIGMGYLRKGYEQAVELSELNPEDNFYHLLQAMYFDATGQSELAIQQFENAMLKGYTSGMEHLIQVHWDMGDTSHWTAFYTYEWSEIDSELLPLLPHIYELRMKSKTDKARAVERFRVISREMGFEMKDLLQKGSGWGYRLPYDITVLIGGAEQVGEIFWTNEPKFWMWSRSLHNFRQTDAFRSRVRSSGMLAYWQKHGWPDLCRAKGDDDFECD